MHQEQEPTKDVYPHGRGYGHDYMRGGEAYRGYGYSAREEYEKPRGELYGTVLPDVDSSEDGTPSPN